MTGGADLNVVTLNHLPLQLQFFMSFVPFMSFMFRLLGNCLCIGIRDVHALNQTFRPSP